MNATKNSAFPLLLILMLCIAIACKNQDKDINTSNKINKVEKPSTALQLEFVNEVCNCYSLLERTRNFNIITRNIKNCIKIYSDSDIAKSKSLLTDFDHINENANLPLDYDYPSVIANKSNLLLIKKCQSYRDDLTQFKTDVIQQTGKNLSPVKENIQNLEASLYEIKDDDKLASVYYMIGILYEYDENTKQALKYYNLSADLNIQNNQLGQMFKELLQSN